MFTSNQALYRPQLASTRQTVYINWDNLRPPKFFTSEAPLLPNFDLCCPLFLAPPLLCIYALARVCQPKDMTLTWPFSSYKFLLPTNMPHLDSITS